MIKVINSRIQQKYDTAENWLTNNPILLQGELGYESDTGKIKIGDGTSSWNSLSYINAVSLDSDQIIAGSKTFLERPIISVLSDLPEGYQRVKYLESTGGQYINTGIYYTNGTKLVVDFEETAFVGSYPKVFGTEAGSNNQTFKLDIRSTDSKFGYGNGEVSLGYGSVLNRRYYVEIIDSSFYLNKTFVVKSDSSGIPTNAYPIYLFAANRAGEAVENSAIRLYTFKTYSQNELTSYLVPCYEKETGKAGLYDLVTDTFLTNLGTDDFITGEEIVANVTETDIIAVLSDIPTKLSELEIDLELGLQEQQVVDLVTDTFEVLQDTSVGKSTSYDINSDSQLATVKTVDTIITDTINSTDYVDQSTDQEINGVKTFLERPLLKGIESILPEDYQAVEYIESTGTQYIDTGIENNNITVIISAQFLETPSSGNVNIYGRYTNLQNRDYLGVYGGKWLLGYAGTYTTIGTADTQQHTFKIESSVLEGVKFLVDDTLLFDYKNKLNYSTNSSALLFATSNNGTATDMSKSRIYSCDIYENEILIRYFVPCYRKSDNVIGMYDTVSGNFFVNQGTGTFLRGAAVDTSSEFATLSDIPSLENYPTRVEVETTLNSVLPKKLSDLQNDLTDYYTKLETYTQEEIDAKISAIPKFAIEVITEFPTENISETTVYLKSIEDESQNLYAEYIYIKGSWELLGTARVDLSNYVDKTSNQTIEGTKLFTDRPQVLTSRLPARYQEVEYIESTGKQYIDSELSLPNGFYLEATYELTALRTETNSSSSLFGCQDKDNANRNYFTACGSSDQFLLGYGGGSGYTYFGKAEKNTVYNIKCSNIYGNRFVNINGHDYTLTPGEQTTYSSANMYVFAFNDSNVATYPGFIKLYSMKVSNNKGVLVRDFIPCYDKLTAEIGLYDTVTNTFFLNKGTAPFLIGFDIEDSVSQKAVALVTDIPVLDNYVTAEALNKKDYAQTSAVPAIVNTVLNDKSFITNTVDNLVNYYTKDTTYSREEIDAKISAIPQFDVQVVQSLPETGAKNTIYLKTAVTGETNLYEEYLFIEGKWESLGTASVTVDLTSYVNTLTDQEIEGVKLFKDRPVVYSSKSDLPTEYQRVEYLKSNGTQYIDTNYYANQDTRVVIDYSSDDPVYGNRLFGARDGNTGKFFISSNSANDIYVDYYNQAGTSYTPEDPKARRIIDFDKNLFKINDEIIYSFAYTEFSVPYSSLLFAGNSQGDIKAKAFTIYSCQIYDNGTLIRNFVPCYTKLTGEPGMYDTVEGIFYSSATEYAFEKGNDIVNDNIVRLASLEDLPDLSNYYTKEASDKKFFPIYSIYQSTPEDDLKALYSIMDNNAAIVQFDGDGRLVGDYLTRLAKTGPTNSPIYNVTVVKLDDLAKGQFTTTVYTDSTESVSPFSSVLYEFAAYENTKIEDALVNYYTKEETYTQTEINNKLSAIPKFEIKVVTALPTENISTTTVYLKPASLFDENLYEEYIYVGDKWELIGTANSNVDLSNYVDKISNQVIEGTKVFTTRPQVSSIISKRLPDGYQEVEYIESTGTQYIDTSYNLTTDSRVEFDYYLNSLESFSPFGNFENGAPAIGFTCYITDNHSRFGTFQIGNGTGASGNYNGYIVNAKSNLKYSKDGLYQNDELIYSITTEQITSTNPCYIFCRNVDNMPTGLGTIRLYNFKIYENDTLVRNFVPCYRKNDNTVGLYDLITNNFFSNKGTATFLKGLDIVTNIDNHSEEVALLSDIPDYLSITTADEEITGQKTFTKCPQVVLTKVESGIPEDYQEVEYIYQEKIDSGNGRNKLAFIQSNLSFADIDSFEVDIAIKDTAAQRNIVLCAYNAGAFFVADGKGFYGENLGNLSYSNWDNNYFNDGNRHSLTVTGVSSSVTTKISTVWDCQWYATTYWYGIKFYKNNILLQELIPCYRKSDNVVGMYDSISNTFFTNAGEGAFIKGDDVIPNTIESYVNVATLNDIPTNYVDVETEQSVNGIKDFKDGIAIGGLKVLKDSSDRIAFYFNKNPKVKIGQLDTLFANRVTPDSSNTYDLGRSGVYWRDLYLAGKLSDGTNSITIAQIVDKLNNINFSREDLVSTIGEATTSLSGLMSSTDKERLDTLVALLKDEDDNTIVDTITEVLSIFNQYPEGADLASALAEKANKNSDNNFSTTQTITGNDDTPLNLKAKHSSCSNIAFFNSGGTRLGNIGANGYKPYWWGGQNNKDYLALDGDVVHTTGDEVIGGNKQFNSKPVVKVEGFPLGYTELEYIQSNGSQRIDTGVQVLSSSRVVIDFVPDITKNGAVCWGSDGGTAGRFNLYYRSTNPNYSLGYGAQLLSDSGIPLESKRVVCDWNANVVTIDGKKVNFTPESFVISANSLTLFSTDHWSAQGEESSITVYSCKIYSNNVLVRDFVPCREESSNINGLYDLVNKKFYSNTGSSNFIGGPETNQAAVYEEVVLKSEIQNFVSKDTDEELSGQKVFTNRPLVGRTRIPAEYREVKYIESTGTQYIDTQIFPTLDTGVKLEYSYTTLNSPAGVFGIYQPNEPRTDALFVSTQSGGVSTDTQTIIVHRGYVHLAEYATLNTKYVAEANYKNNSVLKINDFVSTYETTNNLLTNYTLPLFARTRGTDGQISKTNIRLYSASISEGEEIVRNFVPCYRIEDSKAGLYDLITGEFYLNNFDDSNFIAGPITDQLSEVATLADITTAGNFDSSKYYNKTEIDAKIDALNNFVTKVVTELPTANISESTIYLKAASGSDKNLFEEYIYVEGKWELLGTVSSSFSADGYVDIDSDQEIEGTKSFVQRPLLPLDEVSPASTTTNYCSLQMTPQEKNGVTIHQEGLKLYLNGQATSYWTFDNLLSKTIPAGNIVFLVFEYEGKSADFGIRLRNSSTLSHAGPQNYIKITAVDTIDRVQLYGSPGQDYSGIVVNKIEVYDLTEIYGGNENVPTSFSINTLNNITLNNRQAVSVNDLRNYINLNSDQTINGVKTFTNIPQVKTSSKLPEAYQEVEYIEANAAQYIDTEYITPAYDSFKAEIKFMYTGWPDNPDQDYMYVLGVRHNDGTTRFDLIGSDAKLQYTRIGSALSIDQRPKLQLNTNYIQVIDTVNKTLEINTARYNLTYTNPKTVTSSLRLFSTSLNDGTGSQWKMKGRIYYCRFYEYDTLVRDFVPCYRKSDGRAGMYDLVNNKFYDNEEAGNFIVGPDSGNKTSRLVTVSECISRDLVGTVATYNINSDDQIPTTKAVYKIANKGALYKHRLELSVPIDGAGGCLFFNLFTKDELPYTTALNLLSNLDPATEVLYKSGYGWYKGVLETISDGDSYSCIVYLHGLGDMEGHPHPYIEESITVSAENISDTVI